LAGENSGQTNTIAKSQQWPEYKKNQLLKDETLKEGPLVGFSFLSAIRQLNKSCLRILRARSAKL
jgi:hypothetical protein